MRGDEIPDPTAVLGAGWSLRRLGASGFCSTWRGERGGRVLFVKSLPGHAGDALDAEADGLAALAATATVRVPAIAGIGNDGVSAWLALEWLDLARPTPGFGARLGRALAALHRHPAGDAFGWHRDNRLGASVQCNRRVQGSDRAAWIAFFRRERLGAMRRQLAEHGRLSNALADAVDAVDASLPACFDDGFRPRPSLIHGDLWSGNWGMLADGSPVIFDPAVSESDAEAELAMMELFGAPPDGFWPAYRTSAGLHAGYPRRRPLYQLYHLLNHVLLFGAGYEPQALACARNIA